MSVHFATLFTLLVVCMQQVHIIFIIVCFALTPTSFVLSKLFVPLELLEYSFTHMVIRLKMHVMKNHHNLLCW